MTTIASTGALTSPTTPDSLTTGTVKTATLILANTEYPYTFPAQTKTFILHARTGARVEVAFAAGDLAAGDYLTVPPGCNYGRENIGSASTTLYVRSPAAGLVVEFESWV